MYTGLTDSLWRGAERKELSLTLNGTAVTGALLTLTVTASVNGEQPLLTVGNTSAKTVQMQFSGVQTGFLEGVLVLSAQSGAEALPLGTFAVTEAVTRGGQTTVTAVDAMGVALAELYQPTLSGAGGHGVGGLERCGCQDRGGAVRPGQWVSERAGRGVHGVPGGGVHSSDGGGLDRRAVRVQRGHRPGGKAGFHLVQRQRDDPAPGGLL